MKRKLLALALSIVLILSITPLGAFTAFADDKITLTSAGTTVNKNYLPRVGEPVISPYDFISVSNGDVYEKKWERGSWYSDELTGVSSDRIEVSNENITVHEEEIGYTFEAGRTYYYLFDLKIKTQFRSSHVFANGKNAVNFNVRNLAESEYKVHSTWGRGDTLTVVLRFDMPGERAYNDIETAYAYKYASTYVNCPFPPMQGKYKPQFYSNYNNYTLETSWEGEFVADPNSAFTDKIYFAAGDYRLILTFTAKYGYKFKENCDFKMVKSTGIDADPDVTITPESKTVKDGRTKFVVTYKFHVEDIKPIDVIKLSNECATKTDFYPRSNQSLSDCRKVGFNLDEDLPYERQYTGLGFSTFDWMNDKGERITQAPVRGMVKYGIHLEMKDEYKKIYVFDDNPTIEIEGLDPDCYWAKCEFLAGNLHKEQIFITLYFVSDYHLKSEKTGSDYDHRMFVSSYEGLKLAMDEPSINYIELDGVYDTLPLRKYQTAVQKTEIKRDCAMKITTQKHLIISGDNTLTVEQVDPTANYYPYDDLFRIEHGGDVTVSGSGSLNVQFGQPNYPAAIFLNKGTLNVEGSVSLFADALYSNVYPQAINNRGKLTITGGSFKCKNTMAFEDAAVILGYNSDTYIDGGTFDATYGNGGTGTNYGLMTIVDDLALEINRGTFKSCGGLHFYSDSTHLSNYCGNTNHTCSSGGYLREPYQITNSFLSSNGGSTQVFELIDKFYANVSIPVAGSTPRDRVVPASEKYKLRTDPTWYCGGVAMGLDTAFETGKQYSVKFDLQTASSDGYRLYGDIEGVSAYVNSKPATVTKSSYSNTVTVEFNLGECKDCVYSINVINVDYPVEFQKPDTFAAVEGDYANVDSKNIKWYKNNRTAPDINWVEMSADEKFVADDYAYMVKVPVKLKNKYEFNLSPYDGTPLIDASIDGGRCDYEPYYDAGGKLDTKWVIVSRIYPLIFDTVIESIDINVTAPVDGEYPTYLADIASGQFGQEYGNFGAYVGSGDGKRFYGHNRMHWYDVTEDRYIYDDETFIAGHEYRVSVRVYSYPDYDFYWIKNQGSFVTATINGEPAELFGTCDAFEHGVRATFTCTGTSPKYSVSGTVKSLGNAYDNVVLQLIPEGESNPAFEITRNGLETGYYFADVPAGTYTLKAMKEGHNDAQYTVTVVDSSVVKDITLLLAGGGHIPGDINGDQTVDNKDLIRLFQYLSEWGVEVNEAALDVNGDQAVDNKDLIRLFQYLSEWNVEIF